MDLAHFIGILFSFVIQSTHSSTITTIGTDSQYFYQNRYGTIPSSGDWPLPPDIVLATIST